MHKTLILQNNNVQILYKKNEQFKLNHNCIKQLNINMYLSIIYHFLHSLFFI